MAKTILIVEDDDLNLKVFDDLLQAEGYYTLKNKNGINVPTILEKEHPDLVLMDIKLPNDSGFDIIKEIKNDNPNLTVVGFSAQLNDDINFDKMKEKNLDYLITNDVSNQDIGFDSNNNEVTIIDKNANTIHLSLKNKYLIAKEILDHVIK